MLVEMLGGRGREQTSSTAQVISSSSILYMGGTISVGTLISRSVSINPVWPSAVGERSFWSFSCSVGVDLERERM